MRAQFTVTFRAELDGRLTVGDTVKFSGDALVSAVRADVIDITSMTARGQTTALGEQVVELVAQRKVKVTR